MDYNAKTDIKLLYFEVVALTPPGDFNERKGFNMCKEKVLSIIEEYIKEDKNEEK